MAERLVPLPATLLARVWSPVPDRPMIIVEKLALFCIPASGGTLQALQLHCTVRLKLCSSQGLWRLWGRLICQCRPSPGLGSNSEVKTAKSKGVPASCGLGLRRTWNSAWESLHKFVSPKLFKKKTLSGKGGQQQGLLFSCTENTQLWHPILAKCDTSLVLLLKYWNGGYVSDRFQFSGWKQH
jgi:hypothetical protein